MFDGRLGEFPWSGSSKWTWCRFPGTESLGLVLRLISMLQLALPGDEEGRAAEVRSAIARWEIAGRDRTCASRDSWMTYNPCI
jgi:hypothetical protein